MGRRQEVIFCHLPTMTSPCVRRFSRQLMFAALTNQKEMRDYQYSSLEGSLNIVNIYVVFTAKLNLGFSKSFKIGQFCQFQFASWENKINEMTYLSLNLGILKLLFSPRREAKFTVHLLSCL